MGVYIKDMEMPTKGEYHMTLYVCGDGGAAYVDVSELPTDEDRFAAVPAADVVEVRHGRWVGYPECMRYVNAYADYHIVCSECEECFSILDNDAEKFDCCPHCGARMDGEDGV